MDQGYFSLLGIHKHCFLYVFPLGPYLNILKIQIQSIFNPKNAAHATDCAVRVHQQSQRVHITTWARGWQMYRMSAHFACFLVAHCCTAGETELASDQRPKRDQKKDKKPGHLWVILEKNLGRSGIILASFRARFSVVLTSY